MKTTFIIFLSFIALSFNIQAQDTNKLLESEKNTIAVFQKTVASVVNVSSTRLARSWWGPQTIEIPSGSGTGFVWDTNGHIVTNYHVVADGGSFKITFHNDTKEYEAKVIGTDPNKDIAVLKLSESPKQTLTPIEVGVSKTLQVGQKAIAIGNPFGV